MRSVHIIESLPALRAVSRKRSRGNASRAHLSSKLESRQIPDRSPAVIPKRFLLAIESEGAVFDTLSRKHEIGYLPAFAGCFSWGQDPSVCGELWRRLALRSKLRGQDPLVILLSALRILNRKSPSVRRTAVGRALDTYLGNPSRDPFNLAASARGSSERMILDWIAMSDNLLKDESYAPIFGAASDFLRSAKNLAPGSETLVYSSSAEAVALNQWEVAGVGDCFLRIAGAERGDFSSYLRSALKNGYDTCPILVVGSTNMAWQAAQAVGGRFFPILPGGEDESWEYFSHEYLPAFLAGEPPTLEARSRDFMRMMLEDVDISPEFAG